MRKKAKTEYVMVDIGYGPQEHWVQAKVLQHQSTQDLFVPGQTHNNLLVEIPGGEQMLVDFWKSVEDKL